MKSKFFTIHWYETAQYDGNRVINDGTYTTKARSIEAAKAEAYRNAASGRGDFHFAGCECNA